MVDCSIMWSGHIFGIESFMFYVSASLRPRSIKVKPFVVHIILPSTLLQKTNGWIECSPIQTILSLLYLVFNFILNELLSWTLVSREGPNMLIIQYLNNIMFNDKVFPYFWENTVDIITHTHCLSFII